MLYGIFSLRDMIFTANLLPMRCETHLYGMGFLACQELIVARDLRAFLAVSLGRGSSLTRSSRIMRLP
jgi:hypothetical protein